MASFKKINGEDVGVKRPFNLEDVQNIWDALAMLNLVKTDRPNYNYSILSGFNRTDEGYLSSGILRDNNTNQLYFYDATDPANRIEQGNGAIYIGLVEADPRTWADGTVRPFYLNYVVSGAEFDGATLVGYVDELPLDGMRGPYIPFRYIENVNIRSNTLTADEVGVHSLTRETLKRSALPLVLVDETKTVPSTAITYSGTSTATMFIDAVLGLAQSGGSYNDIDDELDLRTSVVSLAFPSSSGSATVSFGSSSVDENYPPEILVCVKLTTQTVSTLTLIAQAPDPASAMPTSTKKVFTVDAERHIGKVYVKMVKTQTADGLWSYQFADAPILTGVR